METRSVKRRPRRLDLKKTLFLLPNLITLSSIFCGFYAMVIGSHATARDDFYRASVLIVFAMFFDMLDGRVARMTRTQSAFGLQIDSLADVVSFGAAPALVVYQFCLRELGTVGLVASFAFIAAGAVRLARFNVLTMQASGAPTKPGKYIVGLPIPGAAGILVALIVASATVNGGHLTRRGTEVVLGAVIGLALLMVSSVPFRSMKELKLNVATVSLVVVALGSSALVSLWLGPAFALLWLLGAYVVLALCEGSWSLVTRRRRAKDAPQHGSHD